MTRRLAIAAAAMLLLAGCSSKAKTTTSASSTTPKSSSSTASTAPPSSPSSTVTAPNNAPPALVELARFDSPLAITFLPEEPTAAFVAEKTGKVRVFRHNEAGATVVDLGREISLGNEQGLLGITLSPDGSHLYADFTNRQGDTRVVEWKRTGDGVDTSSRRELLAVKQPFANHNGGQVVFGPDKLLYVGLGDGGSAGDPDNRAQNANDILGKIVRLDVREAAPKPEIFALGLRNPWRFTFDRKTGELWIGDVGQNSSEEVDRVPVGKTGANLGWSLREGRQRFKGDAPAGAIEPVLVYPTGPGGTCAVTGGYLYRGTAMAAVAGQYIYADFCAGKIMAASGSGDSWTPKDLNLHAEQLASFGEDAQGELYVLSLAGPIYKLQPAS